MRKIIPASRNVSPAWDFIKILKFPQYRKIVYMRMDFVPPRWDTTYAQVRSQLSGKIFSHVHSFCAVVQSSQHYVLYSLQASLKIVLLKNCRLYVHKLPLPKTSKRINKDKQFPWTNKMVWMNEWDYIS